MVNGNRVHYKPGWDCHGLPIELKAKSIQGDANPSEIRKNGLYLCFDDQLELECSNSFNLYVQLENLQHKRSIISAKNLNHGV